MSITARKPVTDSKSIHAAFPRESYDGRTMPRSRIRATARITATVSFAGFVVHQYTIYHPRHPSFRLEVSANTYIDQLVDDLTMRSLDFDCIFWIGSPGDEPISQTRTTLNTITGFSPYAIFMIFKSQDFEIFRANMRLHPQERFIPVWAANGLVNYPRLLFHGMDKSIDPNCKFSKSQRKDFKRAALKSEFTPILKLKPKYSKVDNINEVMHLFVNPVHKFKPDAQFIHLSQICKEITAKRELDLISHPLLPFVSLAEHLNEHKGKKMSILVRFPGDLRTTLAVSSDTTATAALEDSFSRVIAQGHQVDKSPESVFILSGTNEIIAGPYPLYSFMIIQNFLSRRDSLKINLLELTVTNFSQMIEVLNVSHNHEQVTAAVEFLTSGNTKQPSDVAFVTNDFTQKPLFHFYNFGLIGLHSCPHYLVGSKVCLVYEYVKVPEHLHCSKLQISVCLGDIFYGSPFVVKAKAMGSRHTFDVSVQNLPRYSRLCFKLLNKEGQPFSYGSMALFDRNGLLIGDRLNVNLYEVNFLPPTPGSAPDSKIRIGVRLNNWAVPIYYQLSNEPVQVQKAKRLDGNEVSMLKSIEKITSIDLLNREQKEFLVDNRWRLVGCPNMLPNYLAALDYGNIELMNELETLMNTWTPLAGADLLSLFRYHDPIVRRYLVRKMMKWSDHEISLFLLQLVQSLTTEHDDDSPVALFLLKRALSEPKYLGLQLFWQFRSVGHVIWSERRFRNLIAAFVCSLDEYNRTRILMSHSLTLFQITCCQKYSTVKPDERDIKLRLELENVNILPSTQLPIDPKVVVKKYVPSRCKFLDSAKKPLLITFEAVDPFTPRNISTLLKLNDDLRQDQLSLQILKVMDFIWKQNSMNMHMSLYSVLPTGENQGYIEIVQSAETITALQKKYAGRLRGAFKKDYILKWLQEENQVEELPKHLMTNFIYSVAGYCVATYVLGIGDRHCSNMMIRPDGHFFHIDFGHFLGHFKTALGIRRETEIFYFTDALAHVMGGPETEFYAQFVDLSIQAYNILRKNAGVFISLLSLMLGTGIPELRSNEDIRWVKDKLRLDLSNDQAGDHWKSMLHTVLSSSRTAMNDFFHLAAH